MAWPFWPFSEEMTMMRPKPRSRMPSMTGRVMLKSEFRLVLMTAFQLSVDILWNGPSLVMPALLIRTSTGPRSC